ncbi:MAG: hypothetical protein IIB44_09680 [Candidatus Marinimicrobia bacterium]|nr:hypothetical protein [Candidatus Neomarinimicrobiota bacterium]
MSVPSIPPQREGWNDRVGQANASCLRWRFGRQATDSAGTSHYHLCVLWYITEKIESQLTTHQLLFAAHQLLFTAHQLLLTF